MNSQSWFPLGLTGLISLQSKVLSRIFSSTTVQKYQFFSAPAFLMVQLSQPYMTTGKKHSFDYTKKNYTLLAVMYLLLNTLSRFVTAFLPRSKHLLISRLQLPFTVIFGPWQFKCLKIGCFSLITCWQHCMDTWDGELEDWPLPFPLPLTIISLRKKKR